MNWVTRLSSWVLLNYIGLNGTNHRCEIEVSKRMILSTLRFGLPQTVSYPLDDVRLSSNSDKQYCWMSHKVNKSIKPLGSSMRPCPINFLREVLSMTTRSTMDKTNQTRSTLFRDSNSKMTSLTKWVWRWYLLQLGFQYTPYVALKTTIVRWNHVKQLPKNSQQKPNGSNSVLFKTSIVLY